MRRRADACRAHVDLARIGLGVGDEFGKRLCRYRGIDRDNIGAAANAGDRRDIFDEIEVEVFVERCVDRVRGHHLHQNGVAVRLRAHDRFGADIAAGARPILDDELLAETLAGRLRYDARQAVGGLTGRKADDHAHRLRRIGLRPGELRDGRKRGGPRRQLQKSSAWKFHDKSSDVSRRRPGCAHSGSMQDVGPVRQRNGRADRAPT